MGYHGPSGVIYKYLCALQFVELAEGLGAELRGFSERCADASTGTLLALSRERWDEVLECWAEGWQGGQSCSSKLAGLIIDGWHDVWEAVVRLICGSSGNRDSS